MGIVKKMRTVRESRVVSERIAFPHDANTFGVVYGGKILSWADMVAGLAARKHCQSRVATLRVEFDFLEPIHINDHVRLEAFLTRTFERSFEVQVDVTATSDYGRGASRLAGRGFLVFSCLDEKGRASPVPPVAAETDEERQRWEEAGRRRQVREALRKGSRG